MSGPVAGPVASSRFARYARTDGDVRAESAVKDSLPSRLSPISRARLDGIAARLSECDWQVLSFVSGSRLATGKQLMSGLYAATRTYTPSRARVARKHLKRLASWRVLDALPGRAVGGLHGGSETLVYGVGAAGVRLLARRGLHQRRLGRPGARYVDHTLAGTQVAVDLLVADRRGELELIEVQHEPACWRTFIGSRGERATLKPDLYVRVALPGSAQEYRAMIEVDRATEGRATLRAKTERYLVHYRSGAEVRAHGLHPRIVWAVPDERRADEVRELIGGLPSASHELFAVCLFDTIPRLLISEMER